jgi:hypothetical protein
MYGKIAELRKRANALHNFTKRLDYKQSCSIEEYDELSDLLSDVNSFAEGQFKAAIDAKELRQERQRLDDQLIDVITDLRNEILPRREADTLAVDMDELKIAEALNNAILTSYASMGLK